MLNRGHRSLVHIDRDRYTVAGLSYDLGVNGGVVSALQHILTLQLELHSFKRRTLEDLPYGKACPLESIQQRFGLNGLVAVDGDLTDAGTLRHDHHQHAAVPRNRDVIEIARGKQTLGRCAHAKGIHRIANAHRQRRKHTPRRDPLQAFYADILNDKGLGLSHRQLSATKRSQQRDQQRKECPEASASLRMVMC